MALLVSHAAQPTFLYKMAYKEWEHGTAVQAAVVLAFIALRLSTPTSPVCGDC